MWLVMAKLLQITPIAGVYGRYTFCILLLIRLMYQLMTGWRRPRGSLHCRCSCQKHVNQWIKKTIWQTMLIGVHARLCSGPSTGAPPRSPTCPRKRSATATRASAGHSVYQSMVQQFTKEGNLGGGGSSQWVRGSCCPDFSGWWLSPISIWWMVI